MAVASSLEPVLSAHNIRLGFARDVVLDNVSLEVRAQEFVAIVGASGVGKSTPLRALAGLLPPLQGHITLKPPAEPASRSWSMVFQAPRLFPWRRVKANVELGLEGLPLSRDERRTRALEQLELVGLADLADRWPRTLSGSQQQRVGIARALVVKPQILFMGEPFSALDAIIRRRLQGELSRLRQRTDAAIVFVTGHPNCRRTNFQRSEKLPDLDELMSSIEGYIPVQEKYPPSGNVDGERDLDVYVPLRGENSSTPCWRNLCTRLTVAQIPGKAAHIGKMYGPTGVSPGRLCCPFKRQLGRNESSLALFHKQGEARQCAFLMNILVSQAPL
jgi:NitT/TauT family transport system ATP-binding protein